MVPYMGLCGDQGTLRFHALLTDYLCRQAKAYIYMHVSGISGE